jgi:RecA/RadA recombinase
MPIDRADTEERLARIERMIDEYRADQRRQLLQQLTKFRRLAAAHKPRVALEQSRLH